MDGNPKLKDVVIDNMKIDDNTYIEDIVKLLSTKNDNLDLLTNLSRKDLTALLKMRIVNSIIYENTKFVDILKSFDLDYRSLVVSLGAKGRGDIKDIHKYNILDNALTQEVDSGGNSNLIQKIKNKLGMQ